jgi:carboxyl-terminal processing protease
MHRISFIIFVLSYVGIFASGQAQTGVMSYSERFDVAWRLVSERYWDLSARGIDWEDVREKYEPRALTSDNDETFYRVLEEMYAELGDNHSVFVPPRKVEEIRSSYGDLPCLGVFSQAHQGILGNVHFEMLAGNIGYLKLPDLATPGVAANARSAVATLVRAEAAALILDLRGNPGGRLVEMMRVAGIFTQGFLWRTLTRWTLPLPYPAVGQVETNLPLAVLIDKQVNSAAEGLAGALQQRSRATIVGETSAGNVEAVLPFCLRDGSQAWIATGVLAPIGGPTWEGRGVVPDILTSSDQSLKAALALLKSRL